MSTKKKNQKEDKYAEDKELFAKILRDVLVAEFDEIVASTPKEWGEVSDDHKKAMNKMFKDYTSGSFIPYPDMDEGDSTNK